MSVNYYAKVISKDRKEIIASVGCSLEVRDDIMSGNSWEDNSILFNNLDEDEQKNLSSYMISKSERINKSFLGYVDASLFINSNIDKISSKIKDSKAKLENLKLKQLLAKTDAVYEKISDSISSLENEIELDEQLLAEYESFAHDIYYELNSRSFFYKNNKPVCRDKEYKYRNIKDYDLYFFWS